MNLEPSPSASNSHDLTNTQKKDVQICLEVVREALADVKAKEIVELDVSLISNVSDAIVIASGTSTRHINLLQTMLLKKRVKRASVQLVLKVNVMLSGSWLISALSLYMSCCRQPVSFMI